MCDYPENVPGCENEFFSSKIYLIYNLYIESFKNLNSFTLYLLTLGIS